MTTEYEKDVFAWGNADPWKGRPPLKHGTVFRATDVRTDGMGNILDMPILDRKPCFGRPEVYIRQYNLKKTQMVYGKPKEIAGSRCGSCKIGEACGRVSTERVHSSADIRGAFEVWADQCRRVHGGKRVCTGPVEGRMWEEFKRAVANHGPWSSVNDDRLKALVEEKRRVLREKWRAKRVQQRERDRLKRRNARSAPSREFIENALFERNLRALILEDRAGDRSLPPSISKIRPSDAAATAQITADVWFAGAILDAMGTVSPGPGVVARYLVKWRRDGGRSYASLKARVDNDFRRIRDLEKGKAPVWEPFDPDFDIPSSPSEIDQIMAEMDDD